MRTLLSFYIFHTRKRPSLRNRRPFFVIFAMLRKGEPCRCLPLSQYLHVKRYVCPSFFMVGRGCGWWLLTCALFYLLVICYLCDVSNITRCINGLWRCSPKQ